jgi:hypothetical protein
VQVGARGPREQWTACARIPGASASPIFTVNIVLFLLLGTMLSYSLDFAAKCKDSVLI